MSRLTLFGMGLISSAMNRSFTTLIVPERRRYRNTARIRARA